mmetsp:Transcript_32289/g.102702  ORF Transcript_32289/g.102702 Transcript_32289/m.102702 type:complete len:205 (-) Transcript_32289:51-665(-)
MVGEVEELKCVLQALAVLERDHRRRVARAAIFPDRALLLRHEGIPVHQLVVGRGIGVLGAAAQQLPFTLAAMVALALRIHLAEGALAISNANVIVSGVRVHGGTGHPPRKLLHGVPAPPFSPALHLTSAAAMLNDGLEYGFVALPCLALLPQECVLVPHDRTGTTHGAVRFWRPLGAKNCGCAGAPRAFYRVADGSFRATEVLE